MSDKVEKETAPSGDSKDRVGDILRKERITRRITVETIAKDLKLNVTYIKALEASDYSALPADPYVRVYLKSLAKYLSLDSESILKEFYKERGIGPEHYVKDTSNKIEISMQKSEPKKNPTFVVAMVLICIVGVFAFIANKYGWISKSEPVVVEEKTANPVMVADTLDDDSLVAKLATPVADTVDSAPPQPAVPEKPKTPMNLQVQVIKDSVWIQVFSDGQSWKNILRKGQVRNFSALDSFNIQLGNNQHSSLVLDGKPVKVKGNGVVAVKIDRSGTNIWSQNKWNDVFKDRL